MNFCPNCGAQTEGTATFCANCGAALGAAPPARKDRAPRRWIPVAVLGALIVVGVLYTLWQGELPATGDPSVAHPPPGEIWFGSSFDPDTLEIRGRTDTVSASEPFAAVAALPEPMDGSELAMRIYLDGALLSNTSANAQGGVYEFWGWSLGPLYQPGDWRYEITDPGGNVLASGDLRATP